MQQNQLEFERFNKTLTTAKIVKYKQIPHSKNLDLRNALKNDREIFLQIKFLLKIFKN